MSDMQFQDPINDYDLERQKLARRRKIAEQLMGAGLNQHVPTSVKTPFGDMLVAQPMAAGIGNAITRGVATYNDRQLDQADSDLAAREREQADAILSSIPTDQGPARQQAQFKAMRMPSLREQIKAQMLGDERELDRIDRGEQAAATRVEKAEEAERKRIEDGEQKAADRVAREDLRRIPSQSIHVSVGNGARAGDGKPLTAAQEKAALELGSNRSNLQMLADTFKDSYAGDIRSSIERKFGEVAGGAAPQSTQEMQRWWANQAMFDELPQRHELFGATLTAGEKASWNAAAISPNMSPKMIRERLAVRSKIYDDAEARMRGSVEAGGKSVKQFNAAVGKPRSPASDKLTPQEQAELDALRAKHGRK